MAAYDCFDTPATGCAKKEKGNRGNETTRFILAENEKKTLQLPHFLLSFMLKTHQRTAVLDGNKITTATYHKHLLLNGLMEHQHDQKCCFGTGQAVFKFGDAQ